MSDQDKNVNEKESSCPDELGQRVRELRLERNLTIRELSELSGVSVNTLGMIENCKTSPSVNTLRQISAALQIAMPKFFEPPKHESNLVYMPGAQRKKVTPFPSIHLEALCRDLSGNALDANVISIEPGGKSGFIPPHSGYELVYCLEGSVLYSVDEENFVLEPEDSISFLANVKHKFQNLDQRTSRILVVTVECQTGGAFAFEKLHFST